MRDWVIIFNIVIFFIGNTFAASTHHYIHEDSHHHEVEHECQECVNIENSSNFIFDFGAFGFLDDNKTPVIFENISFSEFNSIQISLSRAPPISL